MDNGIYVALSRQMALFRDMEVTANNLANVNTTGYNAARMTFNTYMMKAGKQEPLAFANDVSTYRDISQGPVRVTGGAFDVALQGEGYFTVESPDGLRYTRAGNFQLDATGTMVTPEGYPVLDQNGQHITFAQEDKNIVVGSAGNISVDGQERATLAVKKFANAQVLQRVGDRLFTSADEEPEAVAVPQVAQGMLEGSNVQPVLEMTHMIEVTRSVASLAKYVEMMYDLQRKTSSTWTQQA